jgi:Tol biopolymer transport system component
MTRLMRRRSAASLVVVCSLLLGCNQTYPNPFTNQQSSRLPPSQDSLVFASDLYASPPTGLLEVYSLSRTAGGTPTRLTFCNVGATPCSILEASFAPDRQRAALRQITNDTNGDGNLTPADGVALVFEDFSRSVQATLAPQTANVNGVAWSPLDGVIVYSANGAGGNEDLFRIDTNGQNNTALTTTGTIRERRPRVDPTGTIAAFERIDSAGKGGIYVFDVNALEDLIDAGGPGSTPLPGTPYMVGADADPAFSPDGQTLVFRRLTGIGNSGLGTWDIMTVALNSKTLSTVATGPLYRGAPDWGPNGILFVETDSALGASSIVLVQPDGSGRTTLFSPSPGVTLTGPRWLPPGP